MKPSAARSVMRNLVYPNLQISRAAPRRILAMHRMQARDCSQRSAEASWLTVENTVDRRLGCLELRSQTRLAPTCCLLEFPE